MSHAPRLARLSAQIDDDALVGRHLHRPIVFTEPERAVHPPSWLDYTPFAFWIVDALRPSLFVELGSHSGNSYASFAQAVQTLGLSTTCYGVDTWRGDPHAGFFDEKVFEEWSAYHDRRFSAFSRMVRSTFDEAVGQFSNGSIDLLHIDGYHTYEAVSHDFEAWRPKMSARGVVLCHDIDVRERDFGAWRLWERLRAQYPHFEFRHGHGLGVLGIGRDLPEPVRWLLTRCTQEQDRANVVRLFFARLGAAVLGRYNAADPGLVRTAAPLVRMTAALTTAERRLDAAHAAATTARAEAMHLRRTVKASEMLAISRTAEVERLTLQAKAREARLAELERDLDASTRTLRLADAASRKLDGEATALLERLQREAHRVQEEAARRTRLEAQLSWSREQIATLGARASHAAGRSRTPIVDRVRLVARSITGGPRAVAQALRIASNPDRLRALRTIEASGLFDQAHYLARHPDLATRGSDPLLHFIEAGGIGVADPHPLFSTTFYVGQAPGLADSGRNPLEHYLTEGWRQGYAPHPLFDPAYYVAQNADAIGRGGNPLTHYLAQGPAPTRNPHPLFDAAFYLREHRDVREARVEPLAHFILSGAREGRRPHPLFDPAFYLERHPDVAARGVNPLEDFVLGGWREGRHPSPAFDLDRYLLQHPDVRASGDNPLVHYVLYGRGAYGPAHGRPAPFTAHMRPRRVRLADSPRAELTTTPIGPVPEPDARRTIVVVSHVGPWRPRAGNEYRVQRMLRWYQQQGYRVIPIIAPLPGEELPREGLDAIAADFGHIVQVHRDGRIEHVLRDLPHALASLDGTFTSSFADLLEEDETEMTPHARQLLAIDRTFCHDALISTVLHLQRSLGPHILQVEYIWMTRLLPLVRGNTLTIVDTHDVFSSIAQKVRLFGVRDVAIEPHEEAERLRRAALAIAIQEDERAELMRLVPAMPVVTAGVDFDVVRSERTPTAGQLLYVASNNARNRKGLDDFLRFAWPRIRQRVPHAALLVVGSVAQALDGREITGVTPLGFVDDLTARYQQAALVINPVVAGTGLKIKMLEALCHLRPIVTWPAGIDGLDPQLAARCHVAHDWYEFSEQVIGVLTGDRTDRFGAADRAAIARLMAADHVYASLGAALRNRRPGLPALGLQDRRAQGPGAQALRPAAARAMTVVRS